MKKISFAFLSIALMLALSGCSLAQPERHDTGVESDRFCGLYMVYDSEAEPRSFHNVPHLEEYGSDSVDLGELGTHAFPRQVLFAGGDGCFPGLAGTPLYNLELEESHGHVSKIVSRMADGEYNIHDSDEGVETDLSGVLYVGPPTDAPEDWTGYDMEGIWTAYRVYQAEDGRAYLDGSGDSFNGTMSITQTATHTRTASGKSVTETVRVTVEIKEVPRLESAAVLQYNADGLLLDRRELPLTEEEISDVPWLDGAAWTLVEEISVKGTIRTAYSRPATGEDSITHPLILLDAQGLGRVVQLTLR